MCTVSFVYTNGKTIITSNRDEKVLRESAIEPKNYLINNKNVIFPKDQKAGGTWYAINEDGAIIVLLNGAAEKHQLKPSYRKSRGLIVLDLISSNAPVLEWELIDLYGIEPFTIVLFIDKKLYQLRWNEVEKEVKQLDASQSYIWSSSTLYSPEIREQRTKWFYTFLDTKPDVSETELFQFHRYTENKNKEYGLIIDRDNFLKTVSITQAIVEHNRVKMNYVDLISEKDFSNTFITV